MRGEIFLSQRAQSFVHIFRCLLLLCNESSKFERQVVIYMPGKPGCSEVSHEKSTKLPPME